MNEKTKRIRDLNDQCRKAMGVLCHLMQTRGISSLPPEAQSEIRERVECFDAFTPDNDPYNEHNFGNFEYGGQKIYWQIDYYNADLSGGSEDPSDVSKTVRVLTIMFASEY